MYLASQKQNLVSAITRDLIPQIAPYEIMLFQQQRETYLSDPEKVLRHVWDTENDEIVFLTPILMAVLDDIVNYLCHEFRQVLQDNGGEQFDCAVRFAFRTFNNNDARQGQAIKLPISESQRATIHRLALTKAQAHRLSQLKSRQLADMIVDNLIIQS